MSLTSSIRSFFSAILHRSRMESELDEELQLHIRDRVDHLVREGVLRSEAERRARLEFGGYQKFKEESRQAVGTHLIENAIQDLRFGLRMLRKAPGFTAVAVLTLALGIGANTAVFSIVNAVLLRPLPLKDSNRIVNIATNSPMYPTFTLGSSWVAFQQIRSQASSLDQCVAFSTVDRTMTGLGTPAQLLVTGVSDAFLDGLGASAQFGRLLNSADQQPGQSSVAVLSDSLWRNQFGADPSIMGRTIVLDGKPYTVVGVASRSFSFPEKTDIWIPVAPPASIQNEPTFFMFQMLGKVRRGHKIEELDAELNTISDRLVKDHPDLSAGTKFKTSPLLETRVQNSRTAYLTLLGASALVLLIACANLASLLLARGWARQREMAMRAALGASRHRLMRQCLVESCLIALGGGAIGALLASGGVGLFRMIAPADTPRLNEITVDSTLLVWSLAAALFSGILFGLAPARRAASADPSDSLKENAGAGQTGARTIRQLRLGHILVVVEIALAFILLIGSALMTQTVRNLLHQDPGFRTDHLLTFDLPQPQTFSKPDDASITRETQRLKQILQHTRAIPGVEAVAATDHGVLSSMTMMHSELQVDAAVSPDVQKRRASARYVSPSYFSMLGVPLLRGREFTDRDAKGAPEAALVNEAMARAYWGTADVVGRHISIEHDEKTEKSVWIEVVGVVADMRDVRVANKPAPEYYLPLLQSGTSAVSMAVRTMADPAAIAQTISRDIWAAFPDQPVTHVATMSHTISESVGDERMRSLLLTVFAGIGFLLAVIGAYGVVSYSVARRIPEIGIRMALGATPSGVLRMVLAQGIVLVAAGIALGAAAAFGVTRVIASQLYGVKPADPFTFALSTVLVLAVACLACCIPARRAMRVDPIVALHYE